VICFSTVILIVTLINKLNGVNLHASISMVATFCGVSSLVILGGLRILGLLSLEADQTAMAKDTQSLSSQASRQVSKILAGSMAFAIAMLVMGSLM
jgi:hypothetical protein